MWTDEGLNFSYTSFCNNSNTKGPKLKVAPFPTFHCQNCKNSIEKQTVEIELIFLGKSFVWKIMITIIQNYCQEIFGQRSDSGTSPKIEKCNFSQVFFSQMTRVMISRGIIGYMGSCSYSVFDSAYERIGYELT